MSALIVWGRAHLRQLLVIALWAALTAVLVGLLALSLVLLAKSNVLSSRPLTDEESKSVWAFLGVALGAVVALIGALLAEQQNQRTTALTRQTADRQQALADEAEHRLKLDTVAKVLELITADSGGYAPPARVAGAIATLIQLGGGVVGVRILQELWAANAVDTDTAVWLINQVLADDRSSAEDQRQATFLLATNTRRLVPAKDNSSQNWSCWPSVLEGPWPTRLDPAARNALIFACVRTLLARDLDWWAGCGFDGPISALVSALDDAAYCSTVAGILSVLIDDGALEKIGFSISDETTKTIQELSDTATFSGWFGEVMAELGAWAASGKIDGPRQSE